MKNVTLANWNVNGIEFEAVSTSEDERLVAGFVPNPEVSDSFLFGASFEDSELAQLVEEGYLVTCRPSWITVVGAFCLRLAPKFPNDEEQAECAVCEANFNWTNDGSQLVETYPQQGPSYACGGTPAEYEAACPSCIDGEW